MPCTEYSVHVLYPELTVREIVPHVPLNWFIPKGTRSSFHFFSFELFRKISFLDFLCNRVVSLPTRFTELSQFLINPFNSNAGRSYIDQRGFFYLILQF